jgi:MFS family permease
MTDTSSAAPTERRASLWRHKDFRNLWAARTVSLAGTQVTTLAIPFTAAVVLGASPMQMGVLTAAGFVPWLVFGLFAGALVDRVSRRAVMIWTDLARVVLILTVPLASLLGVLTYGQVVAAALLMGVMAVFFDTASGAFLPSVLAKDEIMEGNAKLSASASITSVAGPALGGILVQLLTAPIALVVDGLSYLASASLVTRIKGRETPAVVKSRPGVFTEVREGLRFLLRHRTLRALVGEAVTGNLGASMNVALLVLFAIQELHLSAGEVGVAMAFSGVGGVVATLLTRRAADRFGLGKTIAASCVVSGAGALLIPFVSGSPFLAVVLLAVAYFLWGGSVTTYSILAGSLRQLATPERMLGRVLASTSVAISGVNPIGALLGGVLAGLIGFRPTLIVAGTLVLLATLWMVFSPVWHLRTLPETVEELS